MDIFIICAIVFPVYVFGAVIALFYIDRRNNNLSPLIYAWWPIILAKELFKSFIQAVRS